MTCQVKKCRKPMARVETGTLNGVHVEYWVCPNGHERRVENIVADQPTLEGL